jgi:uncharacterized protein (UPF0262 family)
MQNIDVLKSFIWGIMEWLIEKRCFDMAKETDKKIYDHIFNDTDFDRVREAYYICIEWKMRIEKIANGTYQETKTSWQTMARELGAI